MNSQSTAQNDSSPGAFVVVIITSFLSFCFVFILLLHQCYYVLANTTSWESYRGHRVSYLKIYPRGFLPFYKSKTDSLRSVFCHQGRIRDWELPDPASPGIAEFFNICENNYWTC